ncbi:MAG: hypothetical protein ACI9EF_003716 [Pseudohongiellaceae bacterium]|jgi:hypothetical protein
MALRLSLLLTVCATTILATQTQGQVPPGEGPALGTNRIEQSDITGGGLSKFDIRKAGLKIFSTPFNQHDGYGDGPEDLNDTTSPGHRPTLQGNGTFLRINGLDSQSCMECHSVGSNTVAPFRFAIGGVGGSNNNAMFQPTNIDVDDDAGVGEARFNGRYINPPFLFGSGGIELLSKEMTRDLLDIRRIARTQPGVVFQLDTKGVNFGTIRFLGPPFNFIDITGIEGVGTDLVVRPFGRKGDNATVRQFDVGALNFHMGMQPEEDVGTNVDDDGDGVVNEILIGELSALHIFNTNFEPPTQDALTPAGVLGSQVFNTIGCADCHIPTLETNSPVLSYSFPEVHTAPNKNVFYSVDLSDSPTSFALNQGGGISVPLFADLKLHNMGPGLKEDFAGNSSDFFFTTARLWGLADTAPYLHDGRALTLTEAILQHGGEAQGARDNFDNLAPAQRIEVLTYLRSLRTPIDPATDLL